MRKLNLSNYILARYINEDVKIELPKSDYQRALWNLIDNDLLTDAMVFDTFESIKELIMACNSVGIRRLSTNTSDYIVDNDGKGSTAAFSKIIFKLFEARQKLLTLDYVALIKDEGTVFYDTCAFFGFIPMSYPTLPEKFLDYLVREKFVGSEIFKDMKEVEVKDEETSWKNYAAPKQKTFIEMFTFSMMSNVINVNKESKKESNNTIKIVKGKTYQNSFGNYFQEMILTGKNRNENRPSSFSVYVPVCNKGIYTLKDTTLVLKKRAKDLFAKQATVLLQDYLYRVIGSSASFARYYELNKTNTELISSTIQEKILSCFYTQEEVNLSKAELDLAMEGQKFDTAEEYDGYVKMLQENYSFTWNFFVPIHAQDGIDSLTKSEMYSEMLKFFYPEYLNAKGSEGKLILSNKKGYEKYKDIPHKFNKKYDPTLVNNRGDFVLAKRIDDMTIAEELDPFCYYNKTGIRTYLGSYTMLHAFKLDNVEPSKAMTKVTDGMFEKNTPFYNNWYVYMSHRDATGSITTDGMFLFDKDVPVYYGIKAMLVGLEKGQSAIMSDRLYFVHDGKKIYLSAVNPTNSTGRQNPAWQIEGMYHAKRVLDGNTDLIYRDVTTDPIRRDEMLPMQEIFRERNGKVHSLGYHPVGYNKTYFIKDVYSSDYEFEDEETAEMVFKPVKSALGTEYATRANLLGATEMLEAMFGNDDKQEKTNVKIREMMEDETIYNKYRKNGAIIKNYYRSKLPSIISTVLANYKIKENQVMVNLIEKDIKGFLRNLPTSMDVEDAKQRILKGETIKVKLSSLSVRNPSVDNANSISVFVTVRMAHDRAKYSYVEVHPLMWALQGGDFDGDLISLQFASQKHFEQIEAKYGLHNHVIKELFEFKEQDAKSFDTLEAFYIYYATVKKSEEYAKSYLDILFKDGEYRVNSKDEFIKLNENGTLTTMIGKSLIGVSKSVTMKGMSYIEFLMQQEPETFTEDNRRMLMSYCDRMNVDELVQPTIDIQKWSSDTKKVIDIVLRSFYMNEAVALAVESNSLISYMTFAKIRDYLIEAQYITTTRVYTPEYSYIRYELTGSCNFDLIKESYIANMFKSGLINFQRFNTWENTQQGMVECFKYDMEYNPSIATINKLIDVLNPDGNVYAWVKASVTSTMEGFEKSGLSS